MNYPHRLSLLEWLGVKYELSTQTFPVGMVRSKV